MNKALKVMAEMIAPELRATTMCGSAAQVLEMCVEIDRLSAIATTAAENTDLIGQAHIICDEAKIPAGQILARLAALSVRAAAAPEWFGAATPPDDELTVLLELSDGEVWPGFHDAGVWRYISADPIETAHVLRWTHMPAPSVDVRAPMNRSTGMRCPECCAKAGETHLANCPAARDSRP